MINEHDSVNILCYVYICFLIVRCKFVSSTFTTPQNVSFW